MKGKKVFGVSYVFLGLFLALLGAGNYFGRHELIGLLELTAGAVILAVSFVVKPWEKK